jgi:hypothetical protein
MQDGGLFLLFSRGSLAKLMAEGVWADESCWITIERCRLDWDFINMVWSSSPWIKINGPRHYTPRLNARRRSPDLRPRFKTRRGMQVPITSVQSSINGCGIVTQGFNRDRTSMEQSAITLSSSWNPHHGGAQTHHGGDFAGESTPRCQSDLGNADRCYMLLRVRRINSWCHTWRRGGRPDCPRIQAVWWLWQSEKKRPRHGHARFRARTDNHAKSTGRPLACSCEPPHKRRLLEAAPNSLSYPRFHFSISLLWSQRSRWWGRGSRYGFIDEDGDPHGRPAPEIGPFCGRICCRHQRRSRRFRRGNGAWFCYGWGERDKPDRWVLPVRDEERARR